jgi:D-inositol-3-phosphate glycosyltransferase
VILYVGRVNQQKGTDVLIEACRRLNRQRTDTQLVVAGPIGQFAADGRDGGDWRAAIAAVGGLYLGPVDEDRLASVYNLADVFVMPTVDLEMFGMAAVEAQACGKPVVASDHGGLRETVPTTCGARFRVGDPHDLAAKIAGLLDDRPRYDRAAASALTNAACYDWAVINDRLEALYREALR